MTHLLERLQGAIGTQYDVVGELATGGMGIVFRGYDPTLRRPVAIKVLRPELATAAHANRFSREARILARLSHPNVVTVHHAGEADGLFYYVMEFAEGETLADRLATGPLEPAAAIQMAKELLAGLASAHRAGVIHRDLKPANILLRPDRAMIGDFGISLVDPSSTEEDPTAPNPGTRAYMAPEQRNGSPATERSDLYSLAMVLYEAATGRPWTVGAVVERADWRAVPAPLRRALGRALLPAPERRWDTADAMRGAIGRRAAPWIGAAAIAVAAAIAAVVTLRAPPPRPGGLRIFLDPGTVGADPIGDSANRVLRDRLAGAADFGLLPTAAGAQATVRTRVGAEADPIRFTAIVDRGVRRSPLTVVADPVPRDRWRVGADSLADRLIRTLYLEADFDPWLPRDALPKNSAGLGAWYRAERAYGFALWDQAFDLYSDALAIDSTCYLCQFRMIDVERWLSRSVSPERLPILLRHQDAFPVHYRALIRAPQSGRARADSLRAAAEAARDFGIAWFQLGDEEFHRAALHGRPRTDAAVPLLNSVQGRPNFAPGWEHLAWLGLALGDTAMARMGLDSLGRAPDGGARPAALRQVLKLAGYWMFESSPEARAATDQVLAEPRIWDQNETTSGARILLTMGTPLGAIYLGEKFAGRLADRRFVRNGLLGAFFGATGAGQLDRVATFRGRLRRFDPDPEVELFLVEWDAVQSLVRPDWGGRDPVPPLRAAWREAPPGPARDRLAGALAIVDPTAPVEPIPGDLGILVAAVRAARAGGFERALSLTEPLHPLEPRPTSDPFLPLLLRWLRADWLEASGRPGAAAVELGGYRHLQLIGLPNGEPQPGEVDWSFGPDQAWRRARLFGTGGTAAAERCGALADVAHWWAEADGQAGARADSAAAEGRRLGCGR